MAWRSDRRSETGPHHDDGARMDSLDPRNLASMLPVQLDAEARIELATRCRETDLLPKVPRAGRVIEEAAERVQIMFNGLRVGARGYYGDWMMRVIERCRGHHEPQEEVAFAQVMKHLGVRARMIELGGEPELPQHLVPVRRP